MENKKKTLTYDRELYHWLKKGESKEDHKYVRREWKNGRWVYYYNENPTDTRKVQDNLYSMAENVAKSTYKKSISKLTYNKVTKSNFEQELSKHRKRIDLGKTYVTTILASRALRTLNNIGDGTLDNKAINATAKLSIAAKRGRDFIRNLFGR